MTTPLQTELEQNVQDSGTPSIAQTTNEWITVKTPQGYAHAPLAERRSLNAWRYPSRSGENWSCKAPKLQGSGKVRYAIPDEFCDTQFKPRVTDDPETPLCTNCLESFNSVKHFLKQRSGSGSDLEKDFQTYLKKEDKKVGWKAFIRQKQRNRALKQQAEINTQTGLSRSTACGAIRTESLVPQTHHNISSVGNIIGSLNTVPAAHDADESTYAGSSEQSGPDVGIGEYHENPGICSLGEVTFDSNSNGLLQDQELKDLWNNARDSLDDYIISNAPASELSQGDDIWRFAEDLLDTSTESPDRSI